MVLAVHRTHQRVRLCPVVSPGGGVVGRHRHVGRLVGLHDANSTDDAARRALGHAPRVVGPSRGHPAAVDQHAALRLRVTEWDHHVEAKLGAAVVAVAPGTVAGSRQNESRRKEMGGKEGGESSRRRHGTRSEMAQQNGRACASKTLRASHAVKTGRRGSGATGTCEGDAHTLLRRRAASRLSPTSLSLSRPQEGSRTHPWGRGPMKSALSGW